MTKLAAFLLLLGAFVVLAQAPFEGFPGFKDVAPEAGLTLMNVSGEGANDYIIEANGNGAAFFDYDNDGDLDVLVTNGSTLKHYKDGGDPVAALYENSGGVFRNRTAEAGLLKRGWAFGVCVADYDNDGYSDFYVTAYGPNLLFRNNGDGTFEERASAAGVADPHWGTNCAFGDYDRDGDVDLYVANYVAFDGNTRRAGLSLHGDAEGFLRAHGADRGSRCPVQQQWKRHIQRCHASRPASRIRTIPVSVSCSVISITMAGLISMSPMTRSPICSSRIIVTAHLKRWD